MVLWKLFTIFGNMETVFRKIPGWEGLYEVDSVPNIKSVPRSGTLKNGRILKQVLYRDGYLHVCLSKDNKRKMCQVSRLVAMAFPDICGEWFEGAQVHHKDGNRLNNTPSNLVVCTKKQHKLYHIEMGQFLGENNPFYGKHHTEETKLLFSKQHTGMKYTDEVNKKKGIRHNKKSTIQLDDAPCEFDATYRIIPI